MPRRGARDLHKEARWRRALQAQAASGLSVRAWCRRHGLRPPAFYAWRVKLAGRDAEAPVFAPVRLVGDAGPSGRIEILLPGERRVQIVGAVERQMLIDVLAALAATVGTMATAPVAEASAC